MVDLGEDFLLDIVLLRLELLLESVKLFSCSSSLLCAIFIFWAPIEAWAIPFIFIFCPVISSTDETLAILLSSSCLPSISALLVTFICKFCSWPLPSFKSSSPSCSCSFPRSSSVSFPCTSSCSSICSNCSCSRSSSYSCSFWFSSSFSCSCSFSCSWSCSSSSGS